MKQEELIYAIETAMNNHTNWLGWQIVKSLFFAFAFITLLFVFVYIHYSRYPELQNVQAPSPADVCNYPYLECSISDHTSLIVPAECGCGNTSGCACAGYYPILDHSYKICGWQEALAYFEAYKMSNNNTNLKLVCTQ